MPETQPLEKRMTREEYIRLSDEGYFQDRRVELIDGEIIEGSPQNNLHAAGISLVQMALKEAFGADFWVRARAPLDLCRNSLPDPDIAVVAGAPRTHLRKGIPTSALLVGEVSGDTLAFDQGRKASLYAASGVLDYWVLNLIAGQLEVYRIPFADLTQAFGFGYAQLTILTAGDRVRPLALPTASIEVADLLP